MFYMKFFLPLGLCSSSVLLQVAVSHLFSLLYSSIPHLVILSTVGGHLECFCIFALFGFVFCFYGQC